MVRSETLNEIDEAREKEDMRKLESVFFVSGRFLNMQELISYTDLNPIIIRELIDKLKERYEKSESAIEFVDKNEMWKMDVKQEYSSIINKLATGSAEFTKAEQETLAIIAYKQPIKQSVIIKIRGNKAYDHIKKFTDVGLLKKKKEGHTHELSLSDEFYDYFSLEMKKADKDEAKELMKQIEDAEKEDAEEAKALEEGSKRSQLSEKSLEDVERNNLEETK